MQNLQTSSLFNDALHAEKNGQPAYALSIYESILEADPFFLPAITNLGTIYFTRRDFLSAEQLFRRAIACDSSYLLGYFNLGNVLEELGMIEESVEAYCKAIDLSPSYADAHYNLALLCERRGQNRRALFHWQSYLRLDNRGSWADQARLRIRILLDREKLFIISRTDGLYPFRGRRSRSSLELVSGSL